MKLARIVHSMNPKAGGVAEAIRQFGKIAPELGVEMEVWSLDPADSPWLDSLPFPVHACRTGLGFYGYSPGLVSRLVLEWKEMDGVILDGLWQYSSLAGYRACRQLRKDYWVMPHGMLDPWFKETYPLKHFKKCLYWPWAEYRILRDAKAVIFTAEDEARKAKKSFRRHRWEEKVVPLGIEDPLPRLSSELSRPQEAAYLLFLGRIDVKKSVDLLVDAYLELKEEGADLPKLVFAGPGVESEFGMACQRKAEECEEISFVGMKSGDEKWSWIRHAEGMILPSHQENYCLSIVEAMACGIPVLISHAMDLAGEVEKTGAGLCEEDTTEGIKELLKRWLEMSGEEKRAIGKNARKAFEEKWDIQVAARKFLEVMECC